MNSHDSDAIPTADIQRVFALQRAQRSRLKAENAVQRKARLAKLRAAVIAHADAIDLALHQDLRKLRLGVNHFEIQIVLGEIDLAQAQLDEWMQPAEVEPSPALVGNRAYIMYEPRGVCVLFGPWNFPFALTFGPLIPILAAGNSAIVKPNEMQPRTSALVAKIIREVFDESEVAVFEGGVPLADALLELPADHIFFTGSPTVGKHIMAAAAKNLISVTLELGGKCPAIFDEGVDLVALAGKIAYSRFLNAGQLCLAVDHVWLPESLRDQFVQILRAVIAQMFYVNGELVPERISRIVDARNLQRVKGYLDEAVQRGAKIASGGNIDVANLTIEPTILTDVPLDTRIMQEEIFGPILPVLTYRDLAEVFEQVDRTGKPLAMYIFSPNEKFVDRVLMNTSSGGVTVNNVMMHHNEPKLPFGGVNQSGMGAYHGINGFRELSHARSVFVQKK